MTTLSHKHLVKAANRSTESSAGSTVNPGETGVVVRVVPLFQPGKRRMWHVLALSPEMWVQFDSPVNAPQSATRRETPPGAIELIKRWSLAWSAEPAEAELMGQRIRLLVEGIWSQRSFNTF